MSTHETPLKYLTTTKIGEKGQLTVPKQFREDLGLGIGAPFAVLIMNWNLCKRLFVRVLGRPCVVAARGTESGDTIRRYGTCSP